jgi:cytoskeleton protein RodZ
MTISADRQPPGHSASIAGTTAPPFCGAPINAATRLREAREARRMTLRDLSNATKIPVKVLHAIEHNDVANPPSFFTRAFVRTYAAEVGLDQTEVLDEYLAQFQGESASEALAPPPVVDVYQDDRPSHVQFLVVLSLAVAYGGYQAFPQTAAPSPPGSAQPSLVTTSAVYDVAETRPPGFTDGMQLQIRSQGPCFVSATADGQPVISRLILPGEQVMVGGREEIVLRVDDPGACTYTSDGVPGRGGRPGGAVSIRIGETDDILVPRMVAANSTQRDQPVPTSFQPVTAVKSTAPRSLGEPAQIDDDSAVIPPVVDPARDVAEPTSDPTPPSNPPVE